MQIFIRLGKQLAVSGFVLGLMSETASAGLLSLSTEIIESSGATPKTFRELIRDSSLYSRVIKDLVPSSSGTLAKGALKDALRVDLAKFVSDGTRITWERSDIVDYLTALISKKCTLNISCEIAFDLGSGQIDDFVEELSQTMFKAIDTKLPKLDVAMATLKKDLDALPSGSSSRAGKEADMAKIQKEIDGLGKYNEAAIRLARPLPDPDLSELRLLCR